MRRRRRRRCCTTFTVAWLSSPRLLAATLRPPTHHLCPSAHFHPPSSADTAQTKTSAPTRQQPVTTVDHASHS
ncbi:hypothetical protein CPC08DRAFT_717195 [Agrocybe pediades]|nr:hypothetical protein CPC08DRAFT_717195 [Agrocybe pediades]